MNGHNHLSLLALARANKARGVSGAVALLGALPAQPEEGRVYATRDGLFVRESGAWIQVAGVEADQYGARWNASTALALTRLGNAAGMVATAQVGTTAVQNDFDAVAPWGGMYLCNLSNDGVEVARYGEPGFSAEGICAGYTYRVPVMVAVPKFWYRVAFRTPGREIWISPRPQFGYLLHDAFMDANGAEIADDCIYIGAHLGGEESVGGVPMLTSHSGIHAKVNAPRSTFRTMARARGTGWEQMDLPTWSALQMLYMAEYASTGSQETLGKGLSEMPYAATDIASSATTAGNNFRCLNAVAARFAVGYTVGIGSAEGSFSASTSPRVITAITPVGNGTETDIVFDGTVINIAVTDKIWCCAQKSGGADALGQKSGRAAGTDGKTQMAYRGVQGFHGNAFTTIDGVNINDRAWYWARNPAQWDDASVTEAAGYRLLGTCPATDGYIKNFLQCPIAPWAFLPGEVGGSSATYAPDYYTQNTGARAPRVGGNASGGANDGAFYWSASNAAATGGWYYCGRLRYKRPN